MAVDEGSVSFSTTHCLMVSTRFIHIQYLVSTADPFHFLDMFGILSLIKEVLSTWLEWKWPDVMLFVSLCCELNWKVEWSDLNR